MFRRRRCSIERSVRSDPGGLYQLIGSFVNAPVPSRCPSMLIKEALYRSK
jgi:hypothetical protein